MPDWLPLLQLAERAVSPGRAEIWFASVAEQLLEGTALHVAQQTYRLVEIEFYLYAAEHPDPFAHRDPLQLQCGRWYFHRSRGVYRGGSFKGVDLTFGNGEAFGGILIRSLAKPDGSVIVGPSLCVDHLLAATTIGSVAALDQAINGRLAWDVGNPLSLRQAALSDQTEFLRTPRVGLSLRRAKTVGQMTYYLMLPYRFLNEPRKIGKGKPQMVLAQHVRGDDLEAIHRVTGCPKGTIRRYVEEFEAGRQKSDFSPYFGVEVGSKGWCRLYGIWERNYR